MNYTVHITRAAERDLASAVDYIERILLNPKAAEDLLDEAYTKIRDLSIFPEKFPRIEDTILKAWGIRFTKIKNYLAFYMISEQENIVFIVRFLYGKRDWISILKEDFSPK